MRRRRRWIAAPLLLAALAASACRQVSSDAASESEPYAVEPIEGTDVALVTLTADGAERIGLETAVVDGRTVPESAVWIDVNGDAWVYTVREPLTYVREQVTVDRYDDGVAFVSVGPNASAEVVTVGVAELIGSEFGV